MTTEPQDTQQTQAPEDTQATEMTGGSAGALVVSSAGDETRFSDRVWPHAWMGPFLDSLSVMPVIAQAARTAGVARQYAYKVKAVDAEFAEAWDEAHRRGVDLLEQNSWRWATVGVEVTETTVIRNGAGQIIKEVTSTRTDRNPQIAMMMLKAHKPEYREQAKVEHSGPGGGPIQHEVDRVPSRERMIALARIAREELDAEIEGELVSEEDVTGAVQGALEA